MVKVEDLERFHIQDHVFLRLPKRKKTLNVQIHHDFFYYYFEQAHNRHHLKNENNFMKLKIFLFLEKNFFREIKICFFEKLFFSRFFQISQYDFYLSNNLQHVHILHDHWQEVLQELFHIRLPHRKRMYCWELLVEV